MDEGDQTLQSLISENAHWWSDIASIALAVIISTVAILSYLSARKTILQPIRSEVIQAQSKLLSSLLGYISPSDKLDEEFDYQGIITLNAFKYLEELGYLLKDEMGVLETSGGFLPIALENIEVIKTFYDQEDGSDKFGNDDKQNISKNAYEAAKEGDFELEIVYLTKKHISFISKLSEVGNDPFMPKAIRELVFQLILEGRENVGTIISKCIEDFLHIYVQKVLESPDKKPPFNTHGLFNEFSRGNRMRHSEISAKLYQEVRTHLRIDERW